MRYLWLVKLDFVDILDQENIQLLKKSQILFEEGEAKVNPKNPSIFKFFKMEDELLKIPDDDRKKWTP